MNMKPYHLQLDGLLHTIVDTYWAHIFVGFKDSDKQTTGNIEWVKNICSEYVNRVALCVTVTPTDYIYSDGVYSSEYTREPGAIVGLINYPRFPVDRLTIKSKAVDLAKILKKELDQQRVTIQYPDETVMIGEL